MMSLFDNSNLILALKLLELSLSLVLDFTFLIYLNLS